MSKIVVIGGLNTDIVASGLSRFPAAGEHVYAGGLSIGPGGKSRNIAEMTGYLTPSHTVSMIGRTVADVYGLYKPPIAALEQAGVEVAHVAVSQPTREDSLPGIALIQVTESGENQIVVAAGASSTLSASDIDQAAVAIEAAEYVIATMECSLEATRRAFDIARQSSARIVFDPGGMTSPVDVKGLIADGVYLLKPNEHEAQYLTGIEVVDEVSAKQAGTQLLALGAENVLITVGAHGAYFVQQSDCVHIPIPTLAESGEVDSTGCGDQTMAGVVAGLHDGKSLEEACRFGVKLGTMQFYRAGIQPVKLSSL